MQVTSSMRPETRGIFHFNALPATRSLYLRLPDIQRVRRRYWSLQKSCAEFAGSRQLRSIGRVLGEKRRKRLARRDAPPPRQPYTGNAIGNAYTTGKGQGIVHFAHGGTRSQ